MLVPPRLFSRTRTTAYTCRTCLARIAKSSRCYSTELPRHSRRSPNVLSEPARTRFAPSPTGYLHLGSLRTALFNYLLAKRTGGQFLLRIEDTDQKRTIPDAEQRLYKDLRWAGLEWDEGPEVGGPFGPYRQSERTALYQEHANKLVESGKAYRCFCSQERLHQLAEQRALLGLPTDYDRTCAGIPKAESDDRAHRGEDYVVRLKVPDRYPPFRDLVYGNVGKTAKPGKRSDDAYEDPILLKSDGLPTYHLANVVDDHHMKITHVVRGTEWLIATPKHLAMYEAFGWDPPQFAHVGLLVDEQGNKLSKRNFDTDIASFRNKMHILPEALNNFVALLGWSHQQRKDDMDMEQLINNFTLKFTKGNTTVTLGKLHFLMSKHVERLARADSDRLDHLVSLIAQEITTNPDFQSYLDLKPLTQDSLQKYIRAILREAHRYYSTPASFARHIRSFFIPPKTEEYTLPADAEWPGRLTKYREAIDGIAEEQWTHDTLLEAIKELVDSYGGKQAYKELRQIVAGGEQGMGILNMMALLGKKETLERFERANEATAMLQKEKSVVSEL